MDEKTGLVEDVNVFLNVINILKKTHLYVLQQSKKQLEEAAEASDDIVVENEEVTTSLSAKKLKLSSDSIVVNNDVVESKECNIIINSSLLINFFGKLCKCPNCGSHLKIIHDISQKDFHMKLLQCELCTWKDAFYTPKTIESEARGRKAYEINTRTCISFREIGIGNGNSEGKVINVEILSKVCPSCKYWEKRRGTPEFEEWQLYHNCPVNHTGSAGWMESAGTQQMFLQSIKKRNLHYLTYLGDGDSKSFHDVVTSDPYPGYEITKAEYIGHAQRGYTGWPAKFKKQIPVFFQYIFSIAADFPVYILYFHTIKQLESTRKHINIKTSNINNTSHTNTQAYKKNKFNKGVLGTPLETTTKKLISIIDTEKLSQ